MSARCALSFVLVFAMLPAQARAAVTMWTEVPVRVYDTTGASAAERRASAKPMYHI